MARRASAFVQDLDELDALSELPLPGSTPSPHGLGRSGGSAPDDAGSTIPVDGVPPTPTVQPGGSDNKAMRLFPSALQANTDVKLAPQISESASSAAPDGAGSATSGEPQPAPLRTQVRLAPELATWIAQVATRDEITTASVITAAALAPSAPEEPEGGGRDPLMRVRRTSSPGRNPAVPVTVSFTGAQRRVIDGLATRWDCTRTAVVATVVRAAMTSAPAQITASQGGSKVADNDHN